MEGERRFGRKVARAAVPVFLAGMLSPLLAAEASASQPPPPPDVTYSWRARYDATPQDSAEFGTFPASGEVTVPAGTKPDCPPRFSGFSVDPRSLTAVWVSGELVRRTCVTTPR